LSKPAEIILRDDSNDGIDRRGFLECMAWAGTGCLIPTWLSMWTKADERRDIIAYLKDLSGK
jgi:hypothetical protein